MLSGSTRPATTIESFAGPRFLRATDAVAIRVFKDSHGVEWRVWSTVPSSASAVAPDLREGWLSFDSGSQRRRVCPIPVGWEDVSEERLELLCRIATPARWSDPLGMVVPPPDAT